MDKSQHESREYECVVAFETKYPMGQDAAQQLWREAEHFVTISGRHYERRTRGTAVADSPLFVVQAETEEITAILGAHDLVPRYTKISCEEI